jgi:hypothetical protein
MMANAWEFTVDLSPDETLRRLRARVQEESPQSILFGDRFGVGYVGSFEGNAFRIRIGRPLSRFYATYVFGRVDGRNAHSVIRLHFGRRLAAAWALWIIRVVGLLLVAATLAAAFRQPVFVSGAVFVTFGLGLLLWAYRLRPDDMKRLRGLITSSLDSSGT